MAADDEQYNTDLINRQVEINEWSYNNKMDTLFVFQVLFMSLLLASILIALNRQGMVGSGFVWYSIIIVLFIDIIIIVNRTMYTNLRRDPTYWNKRHFSEDNTLKSPVGPGEYVSAIKEQYGSRSSACNCT